jgi:hypothetical protein
LYTHLQALVIWRSSWLWIVPVLYPRAHPRGQQADRGIYLQLLAMILGQGHFL